MVDVRNVLPNRGFTFGTRECRAGYEGNLNEDDRWTSCHLKIYEPSILEQFTRIIIVLSSFFGFIALMMYNMIRRRLKRQYLLAKIERRRSRRSSEESANKVKKGAFRNK